MFILRAHAKARRREEKNLRGFGLPFGGNGFLNLSNGFAVRSNGFAARSNGFALRSNGFADRANGFEPLSGGFPLANGFALRGRSREGPSGPATRRFTGRPRKRVPPSLAITSS